MKYHLITLGCQMNMSDSERVRTVLDGMGLTWTDHEEEANLIGILACSVRQKAIDKVYSRIHKWNSWKRKKNLITYISGCILPADESKFLKLFDIVFHMRDLSLLPDKIKQYGVVTPVTVNQVGEMVGGMKDFWNLAPSYQSTFEAFVPIQNGCDKFCTFCAVPYTRGREVSRPSDEIVGEVRELVLKGYKSITLLGQNVNSYGFDRQSTEIKFHELLDKIGQIGDETGKEFWVYFTSPHPRDMSREVLETIARYKCLAKQIHLPLQSGDDKILIKMNRQHHVQRYREIVDDIRSILPTATLFTDIIVGFTHEQEQHFENTRKALREFNYNMAYIAQYSPRPGAASSRWDDDVNKEEKSRRFHILSEDLRLLSLENNKKIVGSTMKVLVRDSDRKNGYLSGHTEGKLIVRFASEDTNLIGKFVEVKVMSAADFSMEGELVNVSETVVNE